MIRVPGAWPRVVTAILGAAAGVMTGCAALLSWDLPPSAPGDEAGASEGGMALGDASGGNDGTRNGLPDALVDADAGPPCVCASAVPAGWTGPWIVSEQPADAPPKGWPPPCADGDAGTLVYRDLDASPLTCTCTCTLSAVAKCDTPYLTLFRGTAGGTNCEAEAGAGQPYALPVDPNCAYLGNPIQTSDSFQVTSSPSSDSCTGGEAHIDNRPPAGYATVAAVCPAASDAGSCAGNGACAPQGAALCIAADVANTKRDFDASCPAEFPYPRTYVADMNDINDERACTTCTCNPVPDSCVGTAYLYAGSCGASVQQVGVPSGCRHLTQGVDPDYARAGAVHPGAGSCAPDPASGQPTGSAMPGSPLLYCCH